MEYPTHIFKEINLAFQLVLESRIKSKTDELELAREKTAFFCNVYFVRRKLNKGINLVY